MEQRKVDLIRSVGVGGVNCRLNRGRGIEEQVKNVVALMFVGADDPRVHRDVIGDEGVGDDAFVQPKVLWRVAGIDGGDGGLELLSVAAGVNHRPEVIVTGDRQGGNRIADLVIRGVERFEAQVILRCPCQRRCAEVGDVAHPPEAHVGAPRHQTGAQHRDVKGELLIASKHVGKCRTELPVLIGKGEHPIDIDLRQPIEYGMVDGRTGLGIRERPAWVVATLRDLDVGVVPVGDALIDRDQAGFQLRLQGGKVLLDRLLKDGPARGSENRGFVLPWGSLSRSSSKLRK